MNRLKLQQTILKKERRKLRKMNRLSRSPTSQRRTRNRVIIQLGILIETAGFLATFGITLETNLQKDPFMKTPLASLFKALVKLNDLAQSEWANFFFWALTNLETFRKIKYTTSHELEIGLE